MRCWSGVFSRCLDENASWSRILFGELQGLNYSSQFTPAARGAPDPERILGRARQEVSAAHTLPTPLSLYGGGGGFLSHVMHGDSVESPSADGHCQTISVSNLRSFGSWDLASLFWLAGHRGNTACERISRKREMDKSRWHRAHQSGHVQNVTTKCIPTQS